MVACDHRLTDQPTIRHRCLPFNPRVTKGIGTHPLFRFLLITFFAQKVKENLLLGIPRVFNSAHFDGLTTTGGGSMPELSFGHPIHLGQFGTLWLYATSFSFTQLQISSLFVTN